MAISGISEDLKAPDLACILGPEGLRSLLEIMCMAYFDLLDSGFVKINTSENEITEEWYVKITVRCRSSDISVIPIHQKEDPTKGKKGKISPTIDFCFRDEFYPQSYFGAECKLLDQDNNKHLKEYVGHNGMGRFLDCRYGSNSSAGVMIGYIRIGDPKIVSFNVEKLILSLSDKPKFVNEKPVKTFKEIYKSIHQRSECISPFTFFHMFYAFECR